VGPVVVRAKAARRVTWRFPALLEQPRSDAVRANETAVRADPDGHRQVRHLNSIRLIDTDLGRGQRNQTWTDPVVSPAEGTLGS
jgi:hypothetical protein